MLFRQCRKPGRWFGRLVLMRMNDAHSDVTDWGLEGVPLEKTSTILDVGCGGGRTVQKLAAAAGEGRVCGADYAAGSVAAARRTNAREIAAGRVGILQGTVSCLPFPEGSFDVVSAVETHYYWPNLREDLGEVLRVLKPGGRLVVIAETYKGRRADWIYRPAMILLGATYLTPEEHERALSAAGYTEVAIAVDRPKGWIRAQGRKAA